VTLYIGYIYSATAFGKVTFSLNKATHVIYVVKSNYTALYFYWKEDSD